ncbi:hydroxypyruvate isomerase family protein [Actinomadura sp. HBU206391]|uniref:hydroxypyruvate isomerase family protein n=1 Tax=Actinomadura sp. HBU206391 TaxID=2731692 RepID=UPI001650A1F8|nr:TIM barrel protein [Actinomadura sp. HBU206391]MBC6463278.1 TIM barrel protein [Actinomadura sp. HBU206391]
MRFDINLSILFTELPLLERPAAARAAGFDAVELWWPFGVPVPGDHEVDALLRALSDAGVRLVGLNFDAGDMAAGERGLLSRPDGAARFRDNVDVVVGIAEETGCRVLNALFGNRVPDLDIHAQEELGVANLDVAAKAALRCDATVVVEALNSHESPEYPITSSEAALHIIDRVREQAGVANVAFLADLYHLARMGEDPFTVIERHAARFGHVQIADAPGRGQPGTGEIPYGSVLDALEASGYAGHVGLEYKPVGPSADSFAWLQAGRRIEENA